MGGGGMCCLLAWLMDSEENIWRVSQWKLPCSSLHPVFCVRIDAIQLSLRSETCLARDVASSLSVTLYAALMYI
jgi:hypothetical protein